MRHRLTLDVRIPCGSSRSSIQSHSVSKRFKCQPGLPQRAVRCITAVSTLTTRSSRSNERLGFKKIPTFIQREDPPQKKGTPKGTFFRKQVAVSRGRSRADTSRARSCRLRLHHSASHRASRCRRWCPRLECPRTTAEPG